jgi:tripartite-type tricarboxylate transporter receptor subunit TctC
MTGRLCALFGAFVLLAGATSDAAAQAWPTRPVKLIVSTGPGLATDIMARLMADRVSRSLGQQIFIENIPGAAGMIGAQAAARAPADGYTFYFAPASALASNQYLYKSVPYDAAHDFAPVAMVCDSSPFAISVYPGLGVKTLPELIAYAKAHPGKLSYAVDSSSGYQVALGKLLNRRAGIDMVEVAYKSTPQMLQETAAGQPQVAISSITASNPYAGDGRLLRIAVSSEKPFPGVDAPPIAETLPGVRIDGWFAVVAPRGTPEPIIAKLNGEIDKVLEDPEILQRLKVFGLATSGAGTPESTGAFIDRQRALWGRLVQELDIKPE